MSAAADLRAIFSHRALGLCACGRVHAVEVEGCARLRSRAWMLAWKWRGAARVLGDTEVGPRCALAYEYGPMHRAQCRAPRRLSASCAPWPLDRVCRGIVEHVRAPR